MVDENQLDSSKIPPTGPGGRITKEDVVKFMENRSDSSALERAGDADFAAATPILEQAGPAARADGTGIRHVPMSKIRKKIAERLVAAQHTAAILTTFNEIDLHNVIDLRTKYKEKFEKTHGVGLGFMSFFARAVVLALKEYERVNAQIEGDDVIYHDYVHLGIAVSTDRGLAVPVLRHAEKMSFAKIESEIKRLAAATRDGKLSLQELSGGTFTITNGGIFGSLLSTPILNPPQSGILGMHAIQKRAVVVNDQVVIRPMMYVALSYDHRLVDGRESVSFLVRLKEYLEDPARLMLEI
jgi:2-oxoglutarate dehydrogenase E2 component (dihydrolipoamide succinyltransferase)